MIRKIGKVIEVFIPKEYKGDRLIDPMDSKKIGFRVMLEDEQIEIIEEQDEYNAEILKNDLVTITKQTISGKEFIDIELYDGDEYE